MRIRQLTISNFRALEKLGPVEIPRMCVIIGENDTGKTSVMLALQAFFNATKIDSPDEFFRKDTKEPITVDITFTDIPPGSPPSAYTGLQGDLRVLCSYPLGENRTVEVFPSRPTDDELANFRGAGVADMRSILRKVGALDSDVSPSKAECEGVFSNYLEQHFHELDWRDDVPTSLSENELGRILPEFVLVPVTRNLETSLSLGERSLAGRLFRQVVRSVIQADDAQRTLADLKERAREGVTDRVDELQELLRQLTNDETLSLEHYFDLDPLKGMALDMAITDSMVREIPVLNRGAGLQNSLLLAIFRLLAQYEASDFIIGIEEPENSLHPRAQREMLWALQVVSQTAQVLATTHSPVFVDLGRFENNVFLTRTATGATVTRTFRDDEARGLRDLLGVRPSDALLAGGGNCAVIVEGDTELHLFPHLFERAGIAWRRLGVSVVSADGPTEDKVMGRVKILVSYGIPTIAILDKDKEALAQDLRRYCETSPYESFRQVFVWGRGEIEDYLPVSLCVEVLNEMLPFGQVIDEDDIDDAKPRLGELGRAVHEKKGPSARWSYGKVEFGDRVGRKIVEQAVELDPEIINVLKAVEDIVAES